mgnify:CR=1 FL=1
MTEEEKAAAAKAAAAAKFGGGTALTNLGATTTTDPGEDGSGMTQKKKKNPLADVSSSKLEEMTEELLQFSNKPALKAINSYVASCSSTTSRHITLPAP